MDCVINPLSGRAVKIDSPAGRRALKYIKKNNLQSSHECITNPLTGRAVKKNSTIGRKILKGLITAPKPKAYTMYKKPIGPVKPPPKPKPTPLIIPKKYDLSGFKTPEKYEDSPPMQRTKSVPKNLGKTKKDKKESSPKAYTMYKKPIGPVKPPPKAYTMYKKPIGPVKPPPKAVAKPKKQTKQEKEQADFDKKMIELKEKQKREAESLIVIENAQNRRRQQDIIQRKLAKLEEFINDTENYLNKKSTRAYNTLMKKYENKEYITSIIAAQMFGDFYPTSQKCLDHFSNYIENFDENDIILEPTAGLGSIVLWLLKKNVKSKIITTDFDANLNGYLKESFEGINQVSVLNHIKSNYLKVENDFHRYDPTIIFLNPPFSNGNDKKYYLNFLFKAIYDLKMSEHAHMERQLFFISPPLTKNEKDGQTINFDDIVISKNKKEEIKEMLNINEEEFIELMPEQTNRIKACKDFSGTNTEAILYQMFLFY
jgi:16S rRNA G966 N2-methylase RsmD